MGQGKETTGLNGIDGESLVDTKVVNGDITIPHGKPMTIIMIISYCTMLSKLVGEANGIGL